MRVWRLESDSVRLGVTEVGGQLDDVRFQTARGTFAPLHKAPWADEPLSDDIPPMLRLLRGDFFCAPFGDSDRLPDEPRPHGATANGVWRRVRGTATDLVLELSGRVHGARVRKRVVLRPGHPVVYQEHQFVGGDGRLPIGHHAMVHADEPLLLGFSRWVWGGTPPTALEPDPQRGRSVLRYPQTFDDLGCVRLVDGGMADLRRFPALERHEDLLMLIADDTLPFAWSAATAPRQGWVWFALRSPRVLRGTILWMSHGGRYYAPWLGRHCGCLGIEEVTSFFHLGHRASTEENFLSRAGYITAVTLAPVTPLVVRYVFGLTPVEPGFGCVTAIEPGDGEIDLRDDAGHRATAPVEWSWVTAPAADGGC